MTGNRQVKSKQRVADHGEVFTAEREVKAMLDLVKHETERVDSRFLEPACGDGNFLAEILRRKMDAVKRMSKIPRRKAVDHFTYERNAVIAAASIYGVDILQDNVEICRERMFRIWNEEYTANCKKEANDACREAVRFILRRNIICGNALSMRCVDEKGQDTDTPIVFSQWAFISQTQLQRKDYRFDRLLDRQEVQPNKKETKDDVCQTSLFEGEEPQNDEGELLMEYVCDYRRVQENG